MKAMKPMAIRAVKVKSLMGMSDEEVQKAMVNNSLTGALPKWEEILEADTVELDTETIFESTRPDGIMLHLYQTTVPFPMDKFPAVLNRMTARQAMNYVYKVCLREKWTASYPNIMAVMNNLDMEMSEMMD